MNQRECQVDAAHLGKCGSVPAIDCRTMTSNLLLGNYLTHVKFRYRSTMFMSPKRVTDVSLFVCVISNCADEVRFIRGHTWEIFRAQEFIVIR